MKKNMYLTVAISSALACGSVFAGENKNEMGNHKEMNKAATQAQMTQDVQQILQDWPQKQQKVAKDMINKYGEPTGVMSSQITWNNPESPWSEIIVYREMVDHDFPIEHKDFLEQAILYQVPADKMDELANFDGSVIVYLTKGRMAARCDQEGANILALNLAHDVITEKKTVEEARDAYADAIKQKLQGKKVAIMQNLQFEPMTAQKAAASDKTVVKR